MASLVPFQQVRSNTVNFFSRYTGRRLWKTITSVSKAGQKKGRQTTRQPIRALEQFYRIGASPLKIKYPGLNEPIRFDDPASIEPVAVEEQTEDELKAQVDMIHDKLEAKGKTKKRRVREKLHPLERGFSGGRIEGQKLGSMPPVGDVSFDDFQTYVLEIKRTSNMTKIFGRVHTMNALVFVGNGKGLAGYAVGKAGLKRSMNAVIKGMGIASRKLFYVELLEGRTIYQDFYAECRNTRIFAQRRPKGFGLVCHPRLQKICEAIGIKDLYVKVEGNTRNYLALTHAFVTGLQNQETHQQLAERKGLHVVELDPNRNYFPKIVASPIDTPLRSDEDLLPIERLNLDDFYGEGRQPLYKEKPKPFYANLPGHLLAEWRKHPFRNMENVQVRLMADGFVERWTRDNRHEYAARWNEKAINGVVPIPQGIGLSAVIPKKE
ncbi:unnamed protein product [Bursaphelenchus xylophilus]|uniref:Small ribosomal subunit protein uS5m n=1 Tax=Bursaphelenchus xylophilus TaxID=6326 RepID=A0A1I7SBG5_BURXY|nr:unnamed protein product [Bursaphelenchus xylophilus]CAG9122015.1 unnamed protein product [Bursaphelenchus xylophilus]